MCFCCLPGLPENANKCNNTFLETSSIEKGNSRSFFVTTTVIQEPSQQVKCIHLKRGMSPLLTNPSSRLRPEITICADHSLPYRILIKGKLINEKKKQP